MVCTSKPLNLASREGIGEGGYEGCMSDTLSWDLSVLYRAVALSDCQMCAVVVVLAGRKERYGQDGFEFLYCTVLYCTTPWYGKLGRSGGKERLVAEDRRIDLQPRLPIDQPNQPNRVMHRRTN